MTKRAIYILFLVFLLQPVYSQSNTEDNIPLDVFKVLAKEENGQGKVVVKQDDQLQSLVSKYIEHRRKDNTIPGYRIRIFSDSGQSARQKASSESGRFKELYPDIQVYMKYEQPNFKIYVGDFRTRSEAFRTYKLIIKDFRNAFLVPSKINAPK